MTTRPVRMNQVLPADFAAALRAMYQAGDPGLETVLKLARDNGWTMQALAASLGVSREAVRLRCLRPATYISRHMPVVPLVPRRPEPGLGLLLVYPATSFALDSRPAADHRPGGDQPESAAAGRVQYARRVAAQVALPAAAISRSASLTGQWVARLVDRVTTPGALGSAGTGRRPANRRPTYSRSAGPVPKQGQRVLPVDRDQFRPGDSAARIDRCAVLSAGRLGSLPLSCVWQDQQAVVFPPVPGWLAGRPGTTKTAVAVFHASLAAADGATTASTPLGPAPAPASRTGVRLVGVTPVVPAGWDSAHATGTVAAAALATTSRPGTGRAVHTPRDEAGCGRGVAPLPADPASPSPRTDAGFLRETGPDAAAYTAAPARPGNRLT